MTQEWKLIRPSFLFLLQNKPEGDIRGVEVGVLSGKNAVTMLDYCDRLFLDLVDILPQPADVEDYCLEMRAKFHKLPSVEAAKRFPDGFFDYVYIDAAHDFENVTKDLNAWWPKVNVGGIFAGHDWWYPDVKKAVFLFFKGKFQRVYGIDPIQFSSYQDDPISWGISNTIPADDGETMDWWLRKE